MSSVPNLVAGRLSRNLPPSISGRTQPPLTVTGYGVSRLGLVRPRAAQAEQPLKPAATRPALRDGVPLKKVTAGLALPQANRLKAYCVAAGRFQYTVIGAAIDRYLLEVVGQLNGAQKDKMAEVAAGLRDGAAEAEAGADTDAAAVATAPAGSDGDGSIAAGLGGLRPAKAPADTDAPSHSLLAGIFSHLLPRCWRSR